MNEEPLCECQAERAAILEHDAGMSRAEAEQVSRGTYCSECPRTD